MAIEDDIPAVGAPEWFISFGDMMSLLLTVFVLLVSMSELRKDDKFHAIADSLREQFGNPLARVMTQSGELRPTNGSVLQMANAARGQREHLLRSSKASSDRGDAGLVVDSGVRKRSAIEVVVYFDELNTELSEAATEQLQHLKAQ